MPRGGAREGAGRKSTWPSGCKFAETKLIRVPERLAEQLLDIARLMDAGLNVEQDIFSCELPETGQVTVDPRNYVALASTEGDKQPRQIVVGSLFEIVPESKTFELQPLNASDLARRLGFKSRSSVNHKKAKCLPDHPEKLAGWIKERDPDGITWVYHESDKLFHPALG